VSRWSVRRRRSGGTDGWGIYSSDGSYHDWEETQCEAMDWAYRYAVAEELFSVDGVFRLRELLDAADWWRKYLEACEVVSR